MTTIAAVASGLGPMNRPCSILFSAGLCGEGTEDHANELLKIDSRGVRAVAEAGAQAPHHPPQKMHQKKTQHKKCFSYCLNHPPNTPLG
ncbi:hypothetical protein NKJ56_29525, partial [Mesorhizobium sp. M0093]|uniref:hypothetical protein n=1 Tax=Mesorhizobium sp. M0093 TaxID=2956877 RepID=UPI00333DC2CE